MIVLPLLAAAPWLVVPLVLAWRMRTAPSLAAESATPPADAPLVSVIVPARNEAHNIARCMRSVLASRYPALELIVVNDRSEDDTGAIARAIAEEDSRVRVIDAAPLPEGWFGKQWACAQAAAVARGALLCFTDADTVHGPELLTRSVNAMRARALGFLTVGGDQEMCTFWERVLQPLVLTMILARYGGVRAVNESPRVVDKIANGQFMLFTAEAYRACGGHEAVRGKVAEDLALAQVAGVPLAAHPHGVDPPRHHERDGRHEPPRPGRPAAHVGVREHQCRHRGQGLPGALEDPQHPVLTPRVVALRHGTGRPDEVRHEQADEEDEAHHREAEPRHVPKRRRRREPRHWTQVSQGRRP